jgi:hypothetical protein
MFQRSCITPTSEIYTTNKVIYYWNQGSKKYRYVLASGCMMFIIFFMNSRVGGYYIQADTLPQWYEVCICYKIRAVGWKVEYVTQMSRASFVDLWLSLNYWHCESAAFFVICYILVCSSMRHVHKTIILNLQ